MTYWDEYRRQTDRICLPSDFACTTAERLAKAVAEKELTTMKKRKITKIVIAAIAAAFMLTSAVFALSSLLSPRDVAEHLGYDSAAEAFESAENEFDTQTAVCGDYSITVQGMVSGEKLEYINDAPVDVNCSYIVVSLARTDGTPLTAENDMDFIITPLVEGYAPWHINAWGLGTSASGMVDNGVLYYLFECKSLEMFADHTVYIAAYQISDNFFAPSSQLFNFGEDGSISFSENYTGDHVMFTLPLDPAKADREAVDRLLEEIGLAEFYK